MKLDEVRFIKDRTICKNCYIKKKRKRNIFSGKLSLTDERIINRTLLVGPSYSGKSYPILKIL